MLPSPHLNKQLNASQNLICPECGLLVLLLKLEDSTKQKQSREKFCISSQIFLPCAGRIVLNLNPMSDSKIIYSLQVYPSRLFPESVLGQLVLLCFSGRFDEIRLQTYDGDSKILPNASSGPGKAGPGVGRIAGSSSASPGSPKQALANSSQVAIFGRG